MSLNIRAVRDKGVVGKERLVLGVEARVDIGKYVLFVTTTKGDDAVSGMVRQTLWLPDHKVDAGDLVVIYTKDSSESVKEKINEDKTKTVFVYWGLGGSIWSHDDAAAVLVKIDDWNWKAV